jgi:hypothetical protein
MHIVEFFVPLPRNIDTIQAFVKHSCSMSLIEMIVSSPEDGKKSRPGTRLLREVTRRIFLPRDLDETFCTPRSKIDRALRAHHNHQKIPAHKEDPMEETLPMRLIDRIAEDITAAWHTGDMEEASRKAEALVSMCPSRADYWMSAACSRAREDNETHTLEAIERAINGCPNDRSAITRWASQVALLVPTQVAIDALELARSDQKTAHATKLAHMIGALEALATSR